jgi:hypothetical protein
MLVLMMPACAQPPAREVVAPVSAPTTGWVASRANPIDASQVLAGPEADLLTYRAEKVAYGPLPLGNVTAYTSYTYDAQRISTYSGYGYRYRWVVQTGVAVPVSP